ncbi:homeobox protein Hox-A7 isoform X2 [Pelodiscus sinensis]|uniref:homeobox protein Hox-A7 isoform X2 n=1 Tax=Pelodiscus sinensis TaxID=13735 RepID=UPI003F6A5C32
MHEGYVCLPVIQIVSFRYRSIQTTSSQYSMKNGSLQVKDTDFVEKFPLSDANAQQLALYFNNQINVNHNKRRWQRWILRPDFNYFDYRRR